MRAPNSTIVLFERSAYPRFLDAPDADRRACLDVDPDVFFPETGESVDPARQICRRCPLRVRCKDWALSRPWTEVYGVWGGMTQQERKRQQMKGYVECGRCSRWIQASKHGAPVRHKNGQRGRWCE